MAAQSSKEGVKELLDYLGARLFHIQNYYHIYSELGLHYNKAVSPESSKVYLDVINRHKGFFMPVQESLRATLTVELCSFIIKKERKYKSLGRAIDELAQLPDAPDLRSEYNQLLNRNANVVSHIEKFRNQYYAHKSFVDLLKLPPSSDKEFQELLADMIKLLNKANSYFGGAVAFMDDAIADTHALMNNLLLKEGLDEAQIGHISSVFEVGRSEWYKN